MTTKEMLTKFDALTKHYLDVNYDKYVQDRVLYLLLKSNEKHIEGKIEEDETGFWLHKSFRQIDVCGSPEIDMAIWHLFNNSLLFWRMLNKELDDCYNELVEISEKRI